LEVKPVRTEIRTMVMAEVAHVLLKMDSSDPGVHRPPQIHVVQYEETLRRLMEKIVMMATPIVEMDAETLELSKQVTNVQVGHQQHPIYAQYEEMGKKLEAKPVKTETQIMVMAEVARVLLRMGSHELVGLPVLLTHELEYEETQRK